ncbi:methionyl-tRNA formyltransferase [Urbifossiella limnaea]|uniref:Methionyl-tRNA formyltransferase n=1 Tax=Urbifossiella limnaea TaxID=2528023 RepID=A0A517XYB8_9BACT|nr:methionyl-tRNA formyltransferase [Urbifossiella limnaea]QDU22530.1 Methionyl-tRNA formyltransferase [Urbifossiella limnaea]
MRLLMMGTGTFAEPTFEALLAAFPGEVVGLVTQPERDGGNKRGSTRQTGKGMAAIAAAAGLPVVQPESINTPEGLAAYRDLRPELVVVAAYGQILSKDVIATPTVGIINVHASLLPKFRGAAPVAYAILSGEARTGVTIIKVTPGLDSGDMILQEATDIFPDDTTGTLEARLAGLGARLAVEAVRKYRAGGPVEGAKQDAALVTKAPKIKKEFGLIDWSKPAAEVERHVRAMQPWPTAYTFLHRPGKEPMRVIVSRIGEGCSVPPERVAEIGAAIDFVGGGLGVKCGNPDDLFVLPVLELQPAGKKRMTAAEFLRGHPIVPGMRFGPEVLS